VRRRRPPDKVAAGLLTTTMFCHRHDLFEALNAKVKYSLASPVGDGIARACTPTE
jgi:hypothetical protein